MESLKNFWQMVTEIWNKAAFGISLTELLIAIGIFLFFMIIRGLFSNIVLHYLVKLTNKTRNTHDDEFADALQRPMRMVPVALGFFFAAESLSLNTTASVFSYNITKSLIAFIIFWGLYRIITPLAQLLEASTGFFTEAMMDWFRKAMKTAIVAIGGATILELWGIEVLPLIAGLGLFGVALALGAQDLFKNLIAGLFVIGERRFHKGDWILVEGKVEGTVEHIGFRTTKVRRFDKAPVYIPNAALSENAVTNFSEMTHRRIKWVIGLEYRTTAAQLEQVRDGIQSYIENNDDFAAPEDVSTFVRIDSFNDSSIDIFLYCFTKTTVWGEWLEVKEQLALAIKKIVEEAGTGFAFPSRSLYIEQTGDSSDSFPLQPNGNVRHKES